MNALQAESRERTASVRHSVFAIYLTSLVQGAFGVVFPASSVLLRSRLGIGDTLYGALFLPGLGLALITSLLGHALLKRWSLKSLFAFGLVSQAATMVLIGVSGSLHRSAGLPVLFAAMVISGPAGGILGITLNTAAVSMFPRSHGGALSVMHGLIGSGATLGPMLVASCTGAGLWIAAPLSLATLLLWLGWIANTNPLVGLAGTVEEEHARSDVPRRLWFRSSTALVYGMGEATFTSWVVVYLRESIRVPQEVAAGALSAFWLAMMSGRLGSSVIMRWFRPGRISLVLAACMSGAFLLVAHCHGASDSILRFGVAGLCCSALFPLMLSQTCSEFPDRTPRVTAIFSAAAMAGLALGSFGVGPLRAHLGLHRIYAYSAVGPAVLLLLLLALRRGAGEAR